MSASSVAAISLPEIEKALARLEQAGGTLRKQGGHWCIAVKGAAVEQVSAGVVAALLSRGHLVPLKGGGFETLAQARARSPRLADHRPPRPAEQGPPVVNVGESPLSWLRARKDKAGQPLISAEQFAAGERLRADYERGCMGSRTTANWDPSATARRGGNGALHVTDQALAARQALHLALDAVGPELAGILVQVCCLAAGIEQAERQLAMPPRAGKTVLGLALTRLARHYGLLRPLRREAGGIGHWGLPEYRPEILPQAEG